MLNNPPNFPSFLLKAVTLSTDTVLSSNAFHKSTALALKNFKKKQKARNKSNKKTSLTTIKLLVFFDYSLTFPNLDKQCHVIRRFVKHRWRQATSRMLYKNV